MTTYTDLSDSVEWFKRNVAVPGTFASLYPETTDDDVKGALVDGFYRAKLDGWMTGYDADPVTYLVTPDITQTAIGLVIVYAGITFIRNEIKNMPTRTNYQAPGVVYEVEHAATVLSETLKELMAEKQDLLINARLGRTRRPTFMRDGYAIRVSEVYVPEVGANRLIGVVPPLGLV